MKNLALKLLIVLTLSCAPLAGYCAGDEQPQAPNKDENAAISDEQAYSEALSRESWPMIAEFINEDPEQDCFQEVSELAARLSAAAHQGNTQRAGRLLMEASAVIRGRYMAKALIWAAIKGDTEVIELLLARADIDAEAMSQAFIEAADWGYVKVVELLLARTDIDSQTMDEALIKAAAWGHVKVVEVLLARGDIGAEAMSRALIEAARYSEPDEDELEEGTLLPLAEVVRLLLEAGADGTITDSEGNTAFDLARQNGNRQVVELLKYHLEDRLRAAVCKGEIEVVKLLLVCRGIDAEAMGQALIAAAGVKRRAPAPTHSRIVHPRSMSVVHIRNDEAVRLLLAVGAANGTITNSTVNTAFYLARQNRNRQVVGILNGHLGDRLRAAVSKGETEVVRQLLELTRENIAAEAIGRALIVAAMNEDIDLVRLLLIARKDINAADIGEALIKAARNGDLNLIKLLLKLARENIAAETIGRALIKAVRVGDIEVVELLLACEDISPEHIGQALIRAAGNGFLEVVELLLACEDISPEHIGRALIGAAGNGFLEVVELLLTREDITAEAMGYAVNEAVGCGYIEVFRIEVFRLLLAASRDISAAVMGRAVNHAACNGNVGVVRLLLEAGADANIKDITGAPSLLWAASGGHAEVVRLLLKAGADVNTVNTMGWTALGLAAYKGHMKVVRQLLAAGADVTITDSEGRTALDLAGQNNHLDVVELLERAEHDARQAAFEAEGAVGQPDEFTGANVRNATAADAVPTPMPRPTIGCDLHARGSMLSSAYESYF